MILKTNLKKTSKFQKRINFAYTYRNVKNLSIDLQSIIYINELTKLMYSFHNSRTHHLYFDTIDSYLFFSQHFLNLNQNIFKLKRAVI